MGGVGDQPLVVIEMDAPGEESKIVEDTPLVVQNTEGGDA